MKSVYYAAAALLCLLPGSTAPVHAATAPSGSEQTVNVLVVAIHGESAARREWQPTIDYLQSTVSGYRFNLVPVRPIDLGEIKHRIASNEIDFVISQPAIYVDLKLEFGITRILTMVKQGGLHEFGSTIITRADSGIHTVEDMRGNVIAGVSKLGFGGWLVGYSELLKHGFDAYQDAGDVVFLGDQPREVEAVRSGEVDAAVIRTGTLEAMAAAGDINIGDFRILLEKRYPDFPLKVSSPLYPEWAFAKTHRPDNTLVKQVALALLSLDSHSTPAIFAHYDSWTFPSDYGEVHELLKSLQVGPYENYGKVTVTGFIRQHGVASYTFLALICIIIFMLIIIYRSNIRLRTEKQEKDRALEDMRHMATHDGLTGLANRELFIEYLERNISEARRRNNRIAVMFVDLDDFKKINDNFGHDIGNDVLKQVAATLEKSIRDNDIVARLSGDEFAILLSDVKYDADVYALAGRLVRQIPLVQLPRQGTVEFGASLGALIAEPGYYDAFELIQKSDELMYHAKKAGKGRYIIRHTTPVNILKQLSLTPGSTATEHNIGTPSKV